MNARNQPQSGSPEENSPSFGFELQLTSSPGADGNDPQADAVRKAINILNAASNGSDQDLYTAAARIHPRALRKLVDMLELIRRNSAGVSLEFEGSEVSISPQDMPRAAARLQHAASPGIP